MLKVREIFKYTKILGFKSVNHFSFVKKNWDQNDSHFENQCDSHIENQSEDHLYNIFKIRVG